MRVGFWRKSSLILKLKIYSPCLIEKPVRTGSVICSDTWRAYTGLTAKGYVHRLVNHGEKEYSDKKGNHINGNHINGLEGFWGYLKIKRKPAAKGGIRREKLPLYLGEYAGSTITEIKITKSKKIVYLCY